MSVMNIASLLTDFDVSYDNDFLADFKFKDDYYVPYLIVSPSGKGVGMHPN